MNKQEVASDKQARRLLDVSEIATHLGTSERHIRRLVEERRIPFLKLGSGRGARLRFDTDRVDHWLDQHSYEPGELR